MNTPEVQLIEWLRANPGRTLMSDSDGTIKAIYTTGFMKCGINPGDLASQLRREDESWAAAKAKHLAHESNWHPQEPPRQGDGDSARA